MGFKPIQYWGNVENKSEVVPYELRDENQKNK